MTVEELASLLHGAGDLRSDEPYVLTPQPNEKFVPPPLQTDEAATGDPRVILVSAPAAVGKSTLAHQLAGESNALLWDLARLRLGDAVLVGSLGRAYGYGSLGDLIPSLASGELSLILDGLDEAYVRAGVEGLESLAADLEEVLGGARPAERSHASFLVLGRSTAIELFALVLEDRGIAPTRLAIGFFSGDLASRLIDAEAGAGVRQQAYAETRDRLIESIRRSIGPDVQQEEENSFLGYAPVLYALGSYLAEPGDVAAALDSQAAQGGAYWDQLVRVNRDILAREQRKVRAQLDAADRVSDQFFTPEHQIQMLLADNPLRLIEAGWTAEDEDARRQATEVARQAMEGHPFVGAERLDAPLMERFVNTVFRDFLVAEVLRADEREALGRITAAFWEGAYAPSSLAAFFYLRPNRDGQVESLVDPDLLCLLHASLTAETLSREEPVTVVVDERGDGLAVSVGRHGMGQTLDFETSMTDHLVLATPVSHTSVSLDQVSLRLSPIGGELALGPQLTVRAPQIELDGARMWIDANDGPAVLLAAEGIALTSGHVDIRQSGDNALLVQSNSAPFPLRRFAVAPPDVVDPGELHDALMDLRRLLVWFEAGPASGGRVGYFKRPLEIAARKGRVSTQMLQFALSAGLLHDEGKLYVATPEEVPIDLFRVRNGEMDANVEMFLRRFIEWRGARSRS
ncbi:MAG: ATP-binding protein [Actinomycetota bacterium]|nr:ATP-binding protein [Actinomycetota bacterium]